MESLNKESKLLKGVYAIKNMRTGTVYIGSSIKSFNLRFRRHTNELSQNKHYNLLLQNDWNKYGADSFEFIIIEIVDVEQIDTIREKERYWIDNYLKVGNYRYNIQTGPPKSYVTISLPRSLIDEIEPVVGSHGYTSITEFIKDACRRLLTEKEYVQGQTSK